MKKLGVIIPYYNNSFDCEPLFKTLMQVLYKQIVDNKDVMLCVVEDGQVSDWLDNYKGIKIIRNKKNMGISYTRNVALDYYKDKVKFILIIDSDDMVDKNFIKKMLKVIDKDVADMIDCNFFVNDRLKDYKKEKRAGVCGIAIRYDLIKNLRFDEDMQISEDTKFLNQIANLNEFIMMDKANSNYYYQYGANENSLCMRYLRKEIGVNRNER